VKYQVRDNGLKDLLGISIDILVVQLPIVIEQNLFYEFLSDLAGRNNFRYGIDPCGFVIEIRKINELDLRVDANRAKDLSGDRIEKCLRNETGKLFVDTVIYTPNDVSIVFSFTRASFFAHTTNPVDLINFMKELMPHKSLGELYDSIGYYRHGKTILYRDLYRYINNHDDQFIIAPGIKGMVMSVFTMRHFNFVFKIIKDSFDNPKNVTRDQVIQKYRDVELNDRVGRLIYAHKFEHLEFNKADFSEELLVELKKVASQSIEISGDKIIIKHLYIERRLDPLNLYLKHATKVESIAALIDYGHSIKDMAKANIFPGDLLLKNFGVTRHGRVIFYDYDEIQKVTEVRFRKIPPPRNDFDEFSAEPTFSVGPNDIFPEEWMNFMVPKGAIREVFMEEHADLFDAKYWRKLQKDIEQGEMLEFFAYDEKKRFEHEKKN